MRKTLGCFGVVEKIGSWRDEIDFYTCPVTLNNGSHAAIIDLYRLFERGALPFSGGILDQPAKIIEAFSLIESLKLEFENDMLEKQKRANSKAQGWQTTHR